MCRGRRALDEKDGKTWERKEGRGKNVYHMVYMMDNRLHTRRSGYGMH
jgi:hypothetical protein